MTLEEELKIAALAGNQNPLASLYFDKFFRELHDKMDAPKEEEDLQYYDNYMRGENGK